MLLSSNYIAQLKEKLDFYTELKDQVVQQGIKINRFSKSIIYALIRNDWKTAEEYVAQFKQMIQEYKKLVAPYPQFWRNAEISFQEYAEAMIFYIYLKEDRIPTHQELEVDETSYIQ
jgi:translin